MQFISLQENLKKGLNIVSHTSSKNINLPILNNILIKAYSGEIEFIGTNLEIGVNSKIRGKVENDGEFTVNSRLITDYINLLNTNEKVLFKLVDNELLIESGNYKTKIKGESSKEFPLIPTIESDNIFSFELESFRKALNSVIFSVSTSENRLELTGVLFSFSKDSLDLAATDSYRLAEKNLKIDQSINQNLNKDLENFKLIIPAKTIQELLRILNNIGETGDGDGKINISFSDNQILFTFNSTSLISRIINGNYPDYKQIIPTQTKTSALVSKIELVRAIKAASLFSKNGMNDILLQIKKNQILVSSFSGASGESKIKIDSKNGGDENEITINFKYILDGLNNIDSELIEILILNSNSPCIIKRSGLSDYLYIIMPIRQ
ncbi:DNA polymerase III subunit beta [Candidatus Falkowbacteria bacterium]|nr:DNA polymerase III subunit beta [Candidatus Falkowbacteria bacterium]